MPTLKVIQEHDERNLLLQYQRALALWSSHCADEAVFGTAGVYANTKLSDIAEANCIIGPVEPSRSEDVASYFRDANVLPQAWYMPGDSTVSFNGLREQQVQIWHLRSLNAILPQTHPQLTIIPARASFPHAREIAAEMRPAAAPAQAGEAAMCHLDDSHVDAIVALHDGKAAAYGSVLSTGEVGFVMELFVRPDLRGQGMGTTIAGRILDVCARSLFRTVCCAVREENQTATSFLDRLGFTAAQRVIQRTR